MTSRSEFNDLVVAIFILISAVSGIITIIVMVLIVEAFVNRRGHDT